MKRFAALFFAAAVAVAAVADPKDWYSISGGENWTTYGVVSVDGYYPMPVYVGGDGSLHGDEYFDYWIATDPNAENIGEALSQALSARNEVETLAENLDNAYIPYTDADGNVQQAKLTVAKGGQSSSSTSQFKMPKKITVDQRYLKKTSGATSEEISLNVDGAEAGKAYGITSAGFAEVKSATADEVHLTSVENPDGSSTLKLKGSFGGITPYGIAAGGFVPIALGGDGIAPDDYALTYNLRGAITNLTIKGAAANQYKCLVSGGAEADNEWDYMVMEGDGEGMKVYSENNRRKIELAGWDSHTSGESCAATLSGMLTDDTDPKRDNHEVLCRVDGKLHYTPIGAVISPGMTLLVQGNYGSSVASPATCTNKLIFASAADSNVKVDATADEHGNVTVTFGIYYK